ncbi:hypothetical protein [Paraglaciecola sp. 20A4]|uniref:hypothetical protein n=1 Tax=Paraglaciecola sp. 20A4 TaxID=2687288 RepID=UPI0014096D6C|nr:hypothetical protein [Paraglaciecola sp. 20A4]
MLFTKMLHRALIVLLAATPLLTVPESAHAHSGPLNVIALNACQEKAKSDACEYEGGHNDLYIGTCQYMATALMCVRNQPIQKVTPKKSGSDEEHTHRVQTETPVNG